MLRKNVTILIVLITILIPQVVFASESIIEGMDILKLVFGETRDIRDTIALLIQQAMGFLGLISVMIILYAGFKYMMSLGSEEKLTEAKQILYNGVIGLVIVLTSYSLSSFVLNAILNAT